MNFEGYEFEHATSIDAIRDEQGQLVTYTSHDRFSNPKGLRLNAYGTGPFVRMKLGALPHVSGVYAVTRLGKVLYVGLAVDIADRWGRRGYSVIDPRNCFVGGQSTNCRINGLVTQELASGASLELWAHLTSAPRPVELELIRALQPPWNIQGL